MKVRFLYIFAAMLSLSALAYAQSPVGRWASEAQGRGGGGAVTLVLNADGTGTFNGGSENKLSDVIIEGNMVSFSFNPIGAGGSITLSMEGEVDGDTLTLNVSGGGPFGFGPLVLTRQ